MNDDATFTYKDSFDAVLDLESVLVTRARERIAFFTAMYFATSHIWSNYWISQAFADVLILSAFTNLDFPSDEEMYA